MQNAKIQDWGMTSNKNNELQAFVSFETESGEIVTWKSGTSTAMREGAYGPWSPANLTLKTLNALGFKKPTIEDIADSDALEMGKEVKIETAVITTENGKSFTVVKKVFVGDAAQTGGPKKLTKDEIKIMKMKQGQPSAKQTVDEIFG